MAIIMYHLKKNSPKTMAMHFMNALGLNTSLDSVGSK